MKKSLCVLFFTILSLMVTGCAWLEVEHLSVSPISHAIYDCGKEAIVEASYYTLSDRSLEFVRLKMPNGKRRTLPRVLSASGVRYTDDVDVIWWI
ncbi:MAG: MliC family protein, partial [Syntrophales bacterium]|nr:MliC family protein [Syntrophales bacterium]